MKAEIFLSPEPAPVIDLRKIGGDILLDHFLPETYDIPPTVWEQMRASTAAPPYTPPRQSRATRFISLRSRGSQRGALRATFRGIDRMIVFESLLELHCLHLLMSDPNVTDIWDQPPPIQYRNFRGKWATHTLDYKATYRPVEIGYMVKPSSKVKNEDGTPSDFARNIGRIRAAAGHRIKLVSEKSFSRIQVQDARLMLRWHRQKDPDADARIVSVIGNLRGAFPIRTAIELSGLENRAFGALVRAYRAGLLAKAEKRRFDLDTLVEVVHAH
jgi:hypothetical protein